jgi:hypothetical protein
VFRNVMYTQAIGDQLDMQMCDLILPSVSTLLGGERGDINLHKVFIMLPESHGATQRSGQ